MQLYFNKFSNRVCYKSKHFSWDLTMSNSNTNWISNIRDTKFTSGYVFTISGTTVFHKSSKQICITRSLMESEFIVLDKSGEEAKWLQNFFEDVSS